VKRIKNKNVEKDKNNSADRGHCSEGKEADSGGVLWAKKNQEKFLTDENSPTFTSFSLVGIGKGGVKGAKIVLGQILLQNTSHTKIFHL
jgi:hypothetical protein